MRERRDEHPCTRKTLQHGAARHRYMCPYLFSVDHVKASPGDKRELSKRDYGSGCCHGDDQEHQKHRGRADALDRRQCAVRLHTP